MKQLACIALLSAGLLGTSAVTDPLWSQESRGQDSRPNSRGQRQADSGQESRGDRDSRFLQAAPHIGDSLPDANGYTADGQPFQLSSLKGQYSVVVFGCLT